MISERERQDGQTVMADAQIVRFHDATTKLTNSSLDVCETGARALIAGMTMISLGEHRCSNGVTDTPAPSTPRPVAVVVVDIIADTELSIGDLFTGTTSSGA